MKGIVSEKSGCILLALEAEQDAYSIFFERIE
jgi:hypothetical protein